ncbi:hypothetical protein CRENBAI_010818, partial [Crenichthys baileyi]
MVGEVLCLACPERLSPVSEGLTGVTGAQIECAPLQSVVTSRVSTPSPGTGTPLGETPARRSRPGLCGQYTSTRR